MISNDSCSGVRRGEAGGPGSLLSKNDHWGEYSLHKILGRKFVSIHGKLLLTKSGPPFKNFCVRHWTVVRKKNSEPEILGLGPCLVARLSTCIS